MVGRLPEAQARVFTSSAARSREIPPHREAAKLKFRLSGKPARYRVRFLIDSIRVVW